ncbi:MULTISPECIES: hypothetical protein [unclassified Streptomyces]|uniref:hypothetical protein n=1 Tax=unclassified Streptomyces TaxID=2593676 RepID=UPI0035D5B8D1
MPAQIEAFASLRTVEAIASKVENAGSSSPASTTFSSAMLIRSAGRFFAAASFRIDASATLRASAWSYVAPTRRGDQPLEPRIRGPFDRGHNPAPGPDCGQHHHQ